MRTECEDQVQQFVKDSYAVKKRKKADLRSETGQMSKDIASYLCRGTRIKIPISQNVSVVRVDTTCSNCGDRSGQAYIIDGKKLCRICKTKREVRK